MIDPKLHHSFSVDYKGKVSYSWWHEDGNGLLVWSTADGSRVHIESIKRARERCKAIEEAIAHLGWSDW